MEAEHESIDLICPSFCHSLWTLGCLKWYNESKNKYFCLIFFVIWYFKTPIAQDMIMKLQTLVICSVGQLFVTDTSFFNVFLICLKKHYSLLEGNW